MPAVINCLQFLFIYRWIALVIVYLNNIYMEVLFCKA